MTRRTSASFPDVAKKPSKKTEARGVTFGALCKMALTLPGVEEGVSYGTPALKVERKFLARLKEDGETIALRIPIEVREILVHADSEVFYITDHYRNYPAVLVRLPKVRPGQLRDLLEQAWREQAPQRLVAAFDGEPPPAKRR